MNLSLSFYPLSRTAKTKTAIYVSISDGVNRLRFPSGLSIPKQALTKNSRNQTKGRKLLNQSHELYMVYNAELTRITDALNEISVKCGPLASLESIKETYLRANSKKHRDGRQVHLVLNEFIREDKDKTEGTKQVYRALSKHIEDYMPEQEISTLNHVIVGDFLNHLEGLGFMNATINKYLKAIKAFMRYCMTEELIKVTVQLETLKNREKGLAWKVALNDKELETLINAELEPRLDKVRILFATQCMSGQRFSDAHQVLTQRKSYIDFIQKKTNEVATVPLHPKLKSYLDAFFIKYPEGYDKISNQKFNIYIKEVFERIGIDREISRITAKGKNKNIERAPLYKIVSSHDGRRTFCTMSYLKGIPSALVMGVSGHTKEETFMEYIVISDEQMKEGFSKW
jgi:integrase